MARKPLVLRDRITKLLIPYYVKGEDVLLNDGTYLEAKLADIIGMIGTGGYTPPPTGIPADDLAGNIPLSKLSSTVQQLLALANTALQEQTQADWDEENSSSPAFIQHKPEIPEGVEVAQSVQQGDTRAVAGGAVYNELQGKANATTVALLRESLDAITGGDTTTAIRTFNEVVTFLANIEDTETLEGIIAGLQTEINKKYTKPQAGIPASDLEGNIPAGKLSQDVQTSLGKANTALQQSDKTSLQGAIDAVQTALNNLIGSGNVQGAIDTFNEVKVFLAGISTDDPILFNQLKSLSDAITALQTTLSTKANSADVYSKSETNAAIQEAVEGIEVGETVVINSDGANIVDEHDNNSVLFAPSARQMKLMYNNFIALYNSLANIAFTNGKPTLDWVGSKTKYALSYGTMTGCTADVAAGQVNEGALRIKLTPTQASYAFTSVTVNGESVATTATGDADGSVYLDIVVNGNITVAATAISGRAVNFNGTGCSIGAAGVAFNQDLDTTITANEHFTLPASITVKIGNTNVAHTYTRAQDNKSATLHIDAANITGDLTITCTADEDAHAVLDLTNVGSGVTVNKANNAHLYVGDTITILPASGNKVTALATVGGNAASLTGDTYAGYSYTIGSGDVSSSGTIIAITATASALQTFNIDLSGVTSDVGVTWNTPSAATSTILEGSAFSITLAKVSGTGVLQIGTCAMNGGTLTPNNGVIETAHVTGDITIAASVAAAPMKVHSYDFTAVQNTAGRNDGKPRYIEDDVAGHFRLYSVNNITQNSEATEDDPAWTAPKWSPSGGSYKGSWANGISNNYRAGYGNRVLDLEPGSDFTIILKGYKVHPGNANSYNSAQITVLFYDSDSIGSYHNGNSAFVNQQFSIVCDAPSGTYQGASGYMVPSIYSSGDVNAKLGGTDAKIPVSPQGSDLYDVVFSYSAQTGIMVAFVVKQGTSSAVLEGGSMTRTGLAITCMQVYGYGSSVPTNLKGIELYNYAMDKTALETLYGITNND